MLFLAKAEHGLLVPQKAAVPLRDLCRRLVDYYGVLADDIAIEVLGEKSGGPGRQLDAGARHRNLLSNAIRHTPAGGRVELAVHERGGTVVVTVGNTGKPIPAEALRGIFDRFVRLNPGGEGSWPRAGDRQIDRAGPWWRCFSDFWRLGHRVLHGLAQPGRSAALKRRGVALLLGGGQLLDPVFRLRRC